MFKRILIISLALFISNCLKAQTHNLTGILIDQGAKTPLQGATVRLRSIYDTAFRLNTVTDSTGSFSFTGLNKDSFRLTISYVGYQKLMAKTFKK